MIAGRKLYVTVINGKLSTAFSHKRDAIEQAEDLSRYPQNKTVQVCEYSDKKTIFYSEAPNEKI